MARIRLEEGDITQLELDAIVSSASPDLELVCGVAAAIAREGGETIAEECRRLGPLEVGQAVRTGGGQLPARIVIHAVARDPGVEPRPEQVACSFRRALELARSAGVSSLGVPALGAGEGGLSLQESARVLLAEARRPVEADPLAEIRFVLRGEPAYRVFEQVDDADRIRIQMEKLRG